MKKIRYNSFMKQIALFTVFNMVWEISFPTVAWALTGGPSQPEVQSFEPVGTTEMVDLSSGDFVYNIPLLDVGGYPINLSYHGGIDMEQEASWVGLGWNINPGVINRNMRGLPDDFKGDKVERTLSTKPNWTVGVDYTKTKYTETFGTKKIKVGVIKSMSGIKDRYADIPDLTNLLNTKSVSFNLGINYNNYKGIGYSFSLGKASENEKGKFGGYNLNLGFSSSGGFNAGGSLSLPNSLKNKLIKNIIGGINPSANFNSREGITNASLGVSSGNKNKYINGFLRFTSNGFHFGEVNSTPSPQPNFHSFGGTVTYTGGRVNVTGRFKGKNRFQVNFNTSRIKGDDQVNVYNSYGYLYQNNSNENLASRIKSDFSRVFDEQINKSTVYMPLAQKTYDAFGASGQGTGSGIRLQESYISPIADAETKIFSGFTPDIGVEYGKGGNTHLGIDVALSFQVGKSNIWSEENNLLNKFPKHIDAGTPALFEPVYFQSLGENIPIDKSRYTAFQGEAAITAELTKKPKMKIRASSIDNAPNKLTNRAKRNQVTSYLTAENAAIAAVSRQIENYPAIESNSSSIFEDRITYPTSSLNVQPNQKNFYKRTLINRNDGIDGNKKPHHLSEVTTLNPDGTRYVYGIPAYNYSTIEQTFAVEAPTNSATNYSNYDADNLSVNNNWGLDHFYLKESTPAYAHSFLLTSILSSDYVDITQDGITDDDYGNYVKINYSKLIPKDINNNLLPNAVVHWRAPYNNSRLQKGLESDESDDKASYVEGTKEVWYMHTIETKDYVAEFYTSYRNDGFDANTGIYGGLGNYAAKKLDKIVLYNRYDRKQKGINATPIKIVHFEYDYSLCKGVFNQFNSAQGKLTLKKVWFSYGKIINTQAIAPYEFIYPSEPTTNPNYNEMFHDYWGNYQDYTQAFGGKYSSNPDDFPFVDQMTNRAILDQYASAWNLSEIKLPSGGKIKINYESDDYAYVQNSPAMEFFKIIGYSEEKDSPISNTLYSGNTINTINNNNYIHFQLHGICTKEELKERYLKNNTSFMVYVKMKIKPNSNSEEWVKAYVEIHGEGDNYGIKDGHGYIKVKSMGVYNNKIRNSGDPNVGINPIAKVGWEFVKENMPWEVFPMSDLKRTGSNGVSTTIDLNTIKKVGIKMYTIIPSIILGTNLKLLQGSFCNEANSDHSYIRLSDPDGFKIGGGCRVKKIEFSDAWNVISGNSEDEHIYGQVYDYTTTDGKGTTISSGVLDYEPLMGGLECPYKIPFVNRHDRKLTISQNYHYADEPVYEGYIPSGNLIYSKVTVRNIKPTDIGRTEQIKKHGTGKVINEFYTAKDFPLIFNKTPFDHRIGKNWALKLLGVNKTDFGAYQGFSLIINDMHGKPRGNKVYNEYDKLMSSVEYVYQTDPNDPSKLLNEVDIIKPNGDIVNNEIIGVDYDITIDPREVKQSHYNAGIELNFETQPPVPPVLPVFWPRFKLNHESTRTTSITKIINKRGLIKKVVAYDIEARVETENLLYDSETGEVLLTSVNNEYGDKQYNFKQPAHWAYEGMSGAYKNIGASVTLNLTNGSAQDNSKILYPGDELINITDISTPEKAWVVSVIAGSTANTVNISTHKNGTEYCTPENDGTRKFLIIRSGRRNLSSAPIGEIATLQNPVNGTQLSFKKVLASSAVEYTDNWPAFKNLKFSTVFCPQISNNNNPPPCILFPCPEPPPIDWYLSDPIPCQENFEIFDPQGLLDNISSLLKTRKKVAGVYDVYYDPLSQRCFWIDDQCFVHELTPCNVDDEDEDITYDFDEDEEEQDEGEGQENDDEEKNNGMDPLGAIYLDSYRDMAFNGSGAPKLHGPNIYDYFTPSVSGQGYGNGNGGDCNPTGEPVYTYKSCKLLQLDAPSYPKGNKYQHKINLYRNSGCSKPNCTIVLINNRGKNGGLNRSSNFLYIPALNNFFIPDLNCQGSYDSRDYTNYAMDFEGGDLNCSGGKSEFWANLVGKHAGYFRVNKAGSPLRNIKVTHQDIRHAFKVFKKCKECPVQSDNKRIESSVELSSKIPYLNGTRGNWRPKVSYSYFERDRDSAKRKLVQTNTTDLNTTKMRTSGTIQNYQPFWNDPTGTSNIWQVNSAVGTSSSPWIATNEVTLVNPNSQELENKNALDIYSAALYSQFQNQAIAVAQNAKYRNILFENFEDFEHGMEFDAECVIGSGTNIVDANFSPEVMGKYPVHWAIWTVFYKNKITPVTSESHSGAMSLRIAHGTFGLCMQDALTSLPGCGTNNNISVVPSFAPEKGTYILDFWAKHTGADDFKIMSMFSNCGNFEFKPIGEVVTVDGWRKYSFEVKVSDDLNNFNITFKNSTADDLFIDDIRFQPMASEMKGFVYEKLTQRLTAELDANNFATFYEYDEQGNLIRVKKETEKGIVTIKENRQNINR